MDDELFHQAVEATYYPLPDSKEQNHIPVYVEPTGDTATDISIAYAIRVSETDLVPVQVPSDAEIIYKANLQAGETKTKPQTEYREDMRVALNPKSDEALYRSIPLPVLIQGKLEHTLVVRHSRNLPEELDATRMCDLLIASLPGELEDNWTEWDEFKHLRDELHGRLYSIAKAVVEGPKAGFMNAVQEHLGGFSTNLQFPETLTIFEVKHQNGVFQVMFEPRTKS